MEVARTYKTRLPLARAAFSVSWDREGGPTLRGLGPVRAIQDHGVMEPILVRRDGGKYRIVAGERRWRAAQRAGLH